MRSAFVLLALSLCLVAAPVAADIRVDFIEGAPTDRFVITNSGACALRATELVIDLGGSAAGLIFDVTEAGAGVQVFQPFALIAGAGALDSVPKVSDGDRRVVLSIRSLVPGAQIAFTIDVDDTIGQRETIVANSEIEGAIVEATAAGVTTSARFSRQAQALVKTPPCN